jgi:hypothetical protein
LLRKRHCHHTIKSGCSKVYNFPVTCFSTGRISASTMASLEKNRNNFGNAGRALTNAPLLCVVTASTKNPDPIELPPFPLHTEQFHRKAFPTENMNDRCLSRQNCTRRAKVRHSLQHLCNFLLLATRGTPGALVTTKKNMKH